MAKPLSPAAQSTIDAFDSRYEMIGPLESWQEPCLASAIRAAADQVAPAIDPRPAIGSGYSAGWVDQQISIHLKLLAIADELEAQS